MSSRSELEVALRIKAQTTGKESVDALGKSIHGLGDGADKNLQALEAELADLANDLGKSGGAAQGAGAKIRGVGDAAEDAAARAHPAHKKIGDGVESISLKLSDLQKGVLAYLGVSNFGPMIKGVADTADEYNNLSARIRLVTGDGEDFDRAFSGVERIALQTNSSLTSTAELFTKIYTAGKDMKMSQEQALALTQTINQAIQVSGASAASADAATIQLIQGLQSGVLRGEEFNSVMEQSPRLARALADGLGVPIGKLREMATAGALTSQVVIQALQSQGAVIEKEYGKIPATIGRAMTNLSTQWTVFIGESDKGMQASQKAAWAINLLARNLDTVASALINAGKAWLAWRAWNIADEFLLISKAAQASALSKGVDTAATVANTVATAGNTAAQAANATARAASAASVGNITGLVGKLGTALTLVKGFSWAFLLTNLPEIGTALGEGAAKLMGYGKAIEDNERRSRAYTEAARAEAQQDAELAAKKKMAADAALGLNEQSRALVASFDADRKAGKSVTESLTELAKAMQLDDLTGIKNAGAALDALALSGKLSAKEVEQAWSQALTGKDLQVFRVNAQAAFDGTEQGARRLAAAMDGAVSEALKRTGKDMAELTSGVGAAARSAINDFDVLTESVDALRSKGVDAGVALSTSLEKAGDTAKTETAINEVIERWRRLGEQGVITGEQLKDGLEKAQKKLDDLKPGIQSVDEAFRQLGMKTPAQLKEMADRSKEAFETIRNSGTATPVMLAEAFRKYAESAIAANGGVATETLKIQAGMRGVVIETDGASRATAKLASETNNLRNAQQRPDKPGITDGSRHGIDRPDNKLSPGEGTNVKRDSYGFNTDTAAVARANGVRGDDVERFTKEFPNILQDKLADMTAKMGLFSTTGTAKSYNEEYGSAFNSAIAAAKQASRKRNDDKPDAPGAPAKVYQVNLNLNGQESKINTADEASAKALVAALQRAQQVAAS